MPEVTEKAKEDPYAKTKQILQTKKVEYADIQKADVVWKVAFFITSIVFAILSTNVYKFRNTEFCAENCRGSTGWILVSVLLGVLFYVMKMIVSEC